MSDERKRIFTDRRNYEHLILAGEEWTYRIWDHSGEDDISRHSHREGANVQIRAVERRGDKYRWSLNWLIYDDPEDRNSRCILTQQGGMAETLEQAAQQALDYQPQPFEIAGMQWYPDGDNGWLASVATGNARIRLRGEVYIWELDFPALERLVGVKLWDRELRGEAATLEEAAHAIVEAPRLFMASLYSLLPETDPQVEAFDAGKAAGRAEARLRILEALS